MKKLLMCSAAIALGLAVAAPAKADGIKLDLAGHFKGYVTWIGEDNPTGATTTERHFDILRETEIHFTGETTLDNGLTVGVHHEADIDNNDQNVATADSFLTEESYAYFSGSWGRVNFGKEDGANYLLEVAAPSADENFDGLRQYINPFNMALSGIIGSKTGGGNLTNLGVNGRGYINTGKLDYADDSTGYANKLTYLTPVWSGLQGGVSYTPDVNGATRTLPTGGSPSVIEGSTAFGVHSTNVNLSYGDAWEGGLRYEGKFQELGVTLGGGYTHVQLERNAGGTSPEATNYQQWNLGSAFTWQQFGLGVVYTRDNSGLNANGEDRTWVVGLDWTSGPFKLGASYLNNHEGLGNGPDLTIAAPNSSNGSIQTTRWAGGVVYTYGPGMTFRGSIGYVTSDLPDEQTAHSNVTATDVLLGTQINF